MLCAAAPDLAILIAARVAQGVGGAMITTASLSLLLGTTAPDRRPHAVRNWAAVGALAAANRTHHRWPPRHARLALGVPDQPADRHRRDRHHRATRATTAGQQGAPHPDLPSACSSRPRWPRSSASSWRSRPSGGPARRSSSRDRRTGDSSVRVAVTRAPEPPHRPIRRDPEGLPAGERRDARVLRRVRHHAALELAVVAGRLHYGPVLTAWPWHPGR